MHLCCSATAPEIQGNLWTDVFFAKVGEKSLSCQVAPVIVSSSLIQSCAAVPLTRVFLLP